jgi:ribose-phosphate pyrophosphokinase
LIGQDNIREVRVIRGGKAQLSMNESSPRTLVLGFPEYAEQARRLAVAAGLDYGEVEIHRFPDGESRVRLPPRLPSRVVFCRSLHRPNEKLIELVLAARTARGLGAGHITLVAPYLCYMRQDKAFVPGEAVSQSIVGALLADWLDALVTVDPHLHRVRRLEEAVPVRRARCLSAASLMANFLAVAAEDPVLVGPDSESRQWVEGIAAKQGLDFCVGEKERLGDREVRIRLPETGFRGRDVIIVDDVASTGRTLEAAAQELASARPLSLSVLVTHALFLEEAPERLRAAGVQNIWSTDSIPHPTPRLELAPLLAGVLEA